MVDIQTSRQLALLSSFDVRSRNLISRSVAIFKIFRFFNEQLIHKNETFTLTTGSIIFDDLLDMIVSSARHPLMLNTHRVIKLNQNVIHFMIKVRVRSYKNGIHSLTYCIILLCRIVISFTGGYGVYEFYVIYIYIDEFKFREIVSKEENKKKYDELEVAEKCMKHVYAFENWVVGWYVT